MNQPLDHHCDLDHLDLRLVGVGLSECEEALTACYPLVAHAQTYARLFDLGVHGDEVNGACPFDALAVEEVLFQRGGRFVFGRDTAEGGARTAAVIIPCGDECGDLIDLAAWRIGAAAVATWRGRASMLGAENIFAPRLGDPLIVHKALADWLRAGRRGVFVIDPQRAAPLLHQAAPLGVMSEDFGRRLRQSLTIKAPRIIAARKRRLAP